MAGRVPDGGAGPDGRPAAAILPRCTKAPSTSCRPTSTPSTWPTGRRSAPPWRASGLTSCSTAGPSPRWTRASPTSTPPSPSMPSAPATSPRRPSAWVPIWSTSPPTMSSTGPPPALRRMGPTGPQSVYGRSKLGGEIEVRGIGGGVGHHRADGLGERRPRGQHGQDGAPAGGEHPDGPLRFVDDQRGCPTFTADLARAVVRLALDRRPGTFHVTNQGETTWYGFARATLAAAGLDPGGSSPSPPPSSTRPGRPRGRRTRGSTTPRSDCPASRCSRSGPTGWTGWCVPFPGRTESRAFAVTGELPQRRARRAGRVRTAPAWRDCARRFRRDENEPTGRGVGRSTMGPPMTRPPIARPGLTEDVQ